MRWGFRRLVSERDGIAGGFAPLDGTIDPDPTLLERVDAQGPFLNGLLPALVDAGTPAVLVEHGDEPASLAHLGHDRRVVRVARVPRDPAPPRQRLFTLELGVAELEDVARQGLLE